MNELTTFDPAQGQQQEQRYAMQLSTANEARAVAEVKAALYVAQAAPRNQFAARNRILLACQRPKLAQTAQYQYNRGGTDVTGPSIRLAEAIAQNWGNIDFGWRELTNENGVSLVETYAWDMETNTRRVTQFTVEHIRTSKKNGRTKLTDPREVYELVANNAARRMRACILAVIPADIVEEASATCGATLNAQFDGKKIDCIKAMVTEYAAVGVEQKQLEVYLGRNLSSISAGQYVNLQRILTSIKDGLAKTDNWFAPLENQGGLDGGMAQIKAQTNTATAKPQETKAAPAVKEVIEPQETVAATTEETTAHDDDGVVIEGDTAENAQNAPVAAETVEGNKDTTKAENASDTHAAAIANAKNFDDLLKVEGDIKNLGDAAIKDYRKQMHNVAHNLRRGGVAIPTPAEHPRAFMWLLAAGGPIAMVKDAWQNLITTTAYTSLPANDKGALASRYKTAINA